MKTTELTGATLDWAVSKAEGMEGHYLANPYGYSTNWIFGGPIIEREKISVEESEKYGWITSKKGPCSIGPTPLEAAMRCYVAFKLGDEVDVPTEFLP